MKFQEIPENQINDWYFENGDLFWDEVDLESERIFEIRDENKQVCIATAYEQDYELIVTGIESRIEGKGYASKMINSLIQMAEKEYLEAVIANEVGQEDSLISQMFIRRDGEYGRFSVNGYMVNAVKIKL